MTSFEQNNPFDSPYDTLDSTQKEIRVCSMTERSSENHIDLLLHTIRLERSNGKFKCLSYAWGSPSKVRHVTVNGTPILVGENLYNLLHKLRKLGLGHNIWIDAICINQNNEEEKQPQLNLMQEIYPLASEVFVGLEGCSPRTTGAEEIFAASVSGNSLNEMPLMRRSPDEIKEACREFIMIFESDWYTRIWTLQEVYLARKVTVILPWGASVPWESFNVLADRLTNQGQLLSLLLTYSGMEYEKLMASVHKFYNHINGLARTKKALPHGQHIIDLIVRHPNMTAKDFKAKIDAFQPMCTSGIKLPSFSCQSTDVEVFTGFTLWLIELLQSLLPLVLEFPREKCNYPTWVPNIFSASMQHENHHRRRMGFYEEYNASKGLVLQVDYDAPNNLCVSGINIDKVSLVSEKSFNLQNLEDHCDVINNWSSFYARQKDLRNFSPSSIFSISEFSITMMAGYVIDGTYGGLRSVNPKDIEAWKDMMIHLIDNNLSIDDDVFQPHLMDSHVAAAFNRKPFWTANGHFGIGPKEMRPTDEIWILGGCKTPLVLRLARSISGETRYLVIGSSFIYGCMFGEAVPARHFATVCTLR